MTGPVYLLFFLSGLSGLIYQVAWVRLFGLVFGNTLYSTSLVVAVFMLGLGVGSYVVGAWADRRYATQPESLLHTYGYFELAIGALGLGLSILLPHLGEVSAVVSSYSRNPNGWYVLSTTSYLIRGAIAISLLTPVTVLMGGTLTLLIRHLVRNDFEIGSWRIAVLYGINTAGAALGCLLTDFALVPASGLFGAQMVAVFFNISAAGGALYVASRTKVRVKLDTTVRRTTVRLKPDTTVRSVRLPPSPRLRRTAVALAEAGQADQPMADRSLDVAFTSGALALSGFAAMGMEILWFRHFTILLGGFRAVFSLLLTVILIGMGAGSLAGGFFYRRLARVRSGEFRRGSPEPSADAARWLMVVQGLFVASTLLGLATADARRLEAVVAADPAYRAALGRAVEAALSGQSGLTRSFTELWFNFKPILLEVGLPALLMGFAFPLANAIIQRAEPSVGRRAGILYLSNTVGAVCGSLAAGFLLLPAFGIQGSATVLTVAAALAVVPLCLATRPAFAGTVVGSTLVAGGAIGMWLLLPSDYIINRALAGSADGRVLVQSEGLTEAITVTEVPGKGRTLFTNGHPMSSTRPLSQRYMRALAHIPLLSIESPETVLVIGFGVGNTTHAAALHPSIRRVEVADLSKDILADSSYFKDVNGEVLNDPRVVVYVNDGRHHLQMQPPASYDLITLEPPPIGYAGVAALYSKEFYELARTRLKRKGYVSQWLPAYQVPEATTLAMIRAFVDVFPQSVLISGAEADLLLLGVNDSRVEFDPSRAAAVLSNAPAVQADLQRLDLGTLREIVGTFVGSAQTLAEATADTAAVSDDRPVQEYGVLSLLNFGEAVPASVVDLSQLALWCPKCFADGRPVPLVDGLDTYLALLDRAYMASPAEEAKLRSLTDRQTRIVAGSAYLGATVPETADLHNLLGVSLAASSRFDEAIAEFRDALRLEPDSAGTHWNLGAALASRGADQEAIEHLRRSVQLDAGNGQAHYDLAGMLVRVRQFGDAVDEYRAAVRLMPDSADAHNGLGIALASQGELEEAIDEFQRALTLAPQSADARRNLTTALKQRRR